MRMGVNRLLKQLHNELSFNSRKIDEYEKYCRQYRLIGEIFKTNCYSIMMADRYERLAEALVEENERILTTIREIEKRVS